jgi:hypothetical protein
MTQITARDMAVLAIPVTSLTSAQVLSSVNTKKCKNKKPADAGFFVSGDITFFNFASSRDAS